jgi:hypothetical protein
MSTYYTEINSAIIDWRDVSSDIFKDTTFYNYLLNNRVASYYCKNLSQTSNETEKAIISAGEERNSIFYKTLKELDKVCKLHNISYLLYKTHKYFDEVIGWDIDIIVKDEDFDRFLEVFSSLWWNCEEDEKRKWKCEKLWYIVIEPHVNISWNWLTFIHKDEMWNNTKDIVINWKIYNKTSLEIEKLSIYFKIIYWPEYLDLYDLKILNLKSLDLINIDLLWFKKIKNRFWNIHNIKRQYFPIFPGSFEVLVYNLSFLIKHKQFNKMMFIHNFYWKNRYKVNWKLPFLTKYIKLWK